MAIYATGIAIYATDRREMKSESYSRRIDCKQAVISF